MLILIYFSWRYRSYLQQDILHLLHIFSSGPRLKEKKIIISLVPIITYMYFTILILKP